MVNQFLILAYNVRLTLPYKLQLRHHRRIQQINRLLEPFVLHKRRICLLSGLHRNMAQQMLNVRNGSASAQQSCCERFSEIVSRNIIQPGSTECSFQCTIVLICREIGANKGSYLHSALTRHCR